MLTADFGSLRKLYDRIWIVYTTINTITSIPDKETVTVHSNPVAAGTSFLTRKLERARRFCYSTRFNRSFANWRQACRNLATFPFLEGNQTYAGVAIDRAIHASRQVAHFRQTTFCLLQLGMIERACFLTVVTAVDFAAVTFKIN